MLPSVPALTQGASLPFDVSLHEGQWHKGMGTGRHQSSFSHVPALLEHHDSKNLWLCTVSTFQGIRGLETVLNELNMGIFSDARSSPDQSPDHLSLKVLVIPGPLLVLPTGPQELGGDHRC